MNILQQHVHRGNFVNLVFPWNTKLIHEIGCVCVWGGVSLLIDYTLYLCLILIVLGKDVAIQLSQDKMHIVYETHINTAYTTFCEENPVIRLRIK